MRQGITTMLFIAVFSPSFGQQPLVESRLSSDTIVFGESVEITLELKTNCPENAGSVLFPIDRIYNLQFEQDSSLEKYADVLLEPKATGTGSFSEGKFFFPCRQQSAAVSLRFLSIGQFVITDPVLLSDSGDTLNVLGSGAVLTVLPPPGINAEEPELIDIKPIRDVPYTIDEFVFYIASALLLIALIWAMIWYWKKRRNHIDEIAEIEVPAGPKPFEIALTALENLRKEKIWKSGKIKEYQSQLTGIIRGYLADAFEINAPEMTTGEIHSAMEGHKDVAVYVEKVYAILTVADLVKFAKAKPGEDIHESFLDSACAFVTETKTLGKNVV